MVYVRYWDFDLHKAMTVFFSLEELLWAKSRDGESADADAVFATCLNAFERENIPRAEIAKSLVSADFDGASVMLGSENSVGTKFIELANQVVVTHAVAHRLELVWADACAEVVFLYLVAEVLSAAYAMLSASLKMNHQMKEMADLLDEDLVSLKAGHGIRWLASQKRVIQAFLRTWVVFVTCLEAIALASVGLKLTTSSPGTNFIGQKFMVVFDDGRSGAGRVVSCVSPMGTAITEQEFKAS